MVRLTDRPDMTLDVYRGRKTTMQQCNNATNNNEATLTYNMLFVCVCGGGGAAGSQPFSDAFTHIRPVNESWYTQSNA